MSKTKKPVRSAFFQKRSIRVYLPVDPDAVSDDFIERDGAHPYVSVRVARAKHTVMARALDPDLKEQYRPFMSLAVTVRGIGGDFKLYAGEYDGEHWEWPKIVDAATATTRIETLLQLDEVDLVTVMRKNNSLMTLSDDEAGN